MPLSAPAQSFLTAYARCNAADKAQVRTLYRQAFHCGEDVTDRQVDRRAGALTNGTDPEASQYLLGEQSRHRVNLAREGKQLDAEVISTAVKSERLRQKLLDKAGAWLDAADEEASASGRAKLLAEATKVLVALGEAGGADGAETAEQIIAAEQALEAQLSRISAVKQEIAQHAEHAAIGKAVVESVGGLPNRCIPRA